MPQNNTLTYRVAELEKEVEKYCLKMDDILENHLPHIKQEIVSLKTRITVLSALNIGAVIFYALLSKFFN